MCLISSEAELYKVLTLPQSVTGDVLFLSLQVDYEGFSSVTLFGHFDTLHSAAKEL